MPASLFATCYSVLELVLGTAGAQSGIAHILRISVWLDAATL
jgi:hypothetical protein